MDRLYIGCTVRPPLHNVIVLLLREMDCMPEKLREEVTELSIMDGPTSEHPSSRKKNINRKTKKTPMSGYCHPTSKHVELGSVQTYNRPFMYPQSTFNKQYLRTTNLTVIPTLPSSDYLLIFGGTGIFSPQRLSNKRKRVSTDHEIHTS